MWLLIVLWILILSFNTIYAFLPIKFQKVPLIRVCAVSVAIIILISGVYQVVKNYQRRIFAHVAKDGIILECKNFPWEIIKTKLKEGNIVYIIEERYGDASLVSIIPDKPVDKYEIYNAIDGVAIKFTCPEEEIPDFRINIKN